MDDESNFNKIKLESTLKCFSKEFPNIILPVKKLLLDWREDERFYSATSNNIDSVRVPQCVHNEDKFYILCSCKYCLDYRKDILQIFNDYVKTQKIWKHLEKAVSKLYLPLVENASPENVKTYDDLIARRSNWLVNGIIGKIKQQHIDFLFDFPWTDKMIVVIFSAILIEDDRHQLFQLMSFLIECFVKVYASGLTTNFKIACDDVPASKFLLTYILNGYNKLCSIAEELSELLFEFERNYLEKMKCSWVLLNKKLYQKYCYNVLSTVIPEFLIKLKEEVSHDEYLTLIAKFKEFEMDMILVKNAWHETNTFFKEYRISEDNQKRLVRLESVHEIFNTIYANNQIKCNNKKSESSSNDIVWDDMISYIKKNWNCLENAENLKIFAENDCEHCQYLLRHNKMFCSCAICLKTGEPACNLEEENTAQVLCIKCSFMKALPKENNNFPVKLTNDKIQDSKTDIEVYGIEKEKCPTNQLKTEVYHYCWAVFKHLKDRKPYQNTNIEAEIFCKNCHRTSCLLALKILSNEISDEVAKYLIKHYQPFGISNEEIMQMLPKIWLCFRKGHFPHDHYDEDFIIKTFWIFVISAYATCLARLNIKQNIPDIGRLTLTSNDIELSLLNKEDKLHSSDLLAFIEKIINSLQSNRKAINSNSKMINDVNTDLKLNSLIISDTDAAVEDINLLSKATMIRHESSNELNNSLTNFCNSDVQASDCDDKTKPAKECNANKPTCFHEKEYRHNRKNETRDRLREKLKKLVTIDKESLRSPEKLEPALPSNDNLQNMRTTANIAMKNDKNICKMNNSSKIPLNEETTNTTVVDVNKYICEDTDALKINGDEKWVKDALSYIEGSKNGSIVVNNKKAAKRQKQKLKKEEYKKVEELKDLRFQFHEVYFKEFAAKKERKNEQLSKKKDKKRISDLENSVKKLSKIKNRIEKDILELISTLKSINSEFKFTYLPTKEEQQAFIQNHCNVKETISNCNHKHTIDMAKVPIQDAVTVETDAKPMRCEKRESIHFSNTEQDMADTSKRIVTIRRVNMPNNNEPQVTVTAKGSSPDEDKILYTVINGRLVQRDCENDSIAESSPGINFTQLSKIKNELIQNNNIMSSCVGYNPNNNKNKSVTKTKTQIKKERKIAKQIVENLNAKRKLGITTNSQITTNENNLKTLNDYPNISNKEITSVTKNKKKNDKYICSQNIFKNLNPDLKSLNTCKENHSVIQHRPSKISDNNDGDAQNCKVTKKHDKYDKKKNRKIHNLNILENNQFNLLHLEDTESFTEESEPDTDASKYKEVLKSKPSVNIIKSNSKNSTMNSKLSESIITPSCTKKNVKCKDRTKKNTTGLKTNVQYSSNSVNVGNVPEKKLTALETSMNNLNINSNIESMNKKSNVTNISIMEQLKRGIQVENLTLPPGITLTKVDPAKAEELKAKTGSIHNLSQQILPQQSSSVHSLFAAEDLLRTDFLPPTVNKFLTDTRGVIMVDNIKKKVVPPKNVPQCVTDRKNKTKMKKRKNKSKSISEQKLLPDSKKVASNIITLRNPMFYLSNPEILPYCNLTERIPQTSESQIDQPATIIRNKNGMFTIRNPVLYQNMAGSNFINNYGAFSPNYYSSMRSFLQDGDINSYVSDNDASNSGKCMSAIGSEIKSAQQKQFTVFQNQNLKNPNLTPDCDYVNGLNSFVPHDSLLYNTYGNYCGSPTPTSNNNTFGNSENVPRNSIHTNSGNTQSNMSRNNYNKLSSLVDLKRLNNEVTIHNTNEKELPPERITQVSTSRSYELENQQNHFKIYNNLQVHNTDYLNSCGRDEFQPRKVTGNMNDFIVNNQGPDAIESALLHTIENNIFCSINSCNENTLFTKQEQMCSRINKI